jgi:RND family efflux transporter MFP subunit
MPSRGVSVERVRDAGGYPAETIQTRCGANLLPRSPEERRMRKVVGIAVIAVVMASAWSARRCAVARAKTTAPGREVSRVTRADVSSVVKATGVVKPVVGAEVRVGSRISGVLERLHVREGDEVARGQLLAELDDRELRARRDQAAAAVGVADVELHYAQALLRRQRELAEARLLSPAALDVAEQSAALAERRLAQSRAALVDASTQLGFARVVAPISGVVASVTVQEGETVAASFAAPTFLTLLDLGRLEVRAFVDEMDIGRIRAGQAATFTVDTYGDEQFAGRVGTVYPQAEIRDNVVTYVCVVGFEPQAKRALRPEMTATVRIAIDTRAAVLTLPLRAVRRDEGGAFAWREVGGKLVRRPLTLGAKDETRWEIVQGLSEGDEVVVETGDST